MMEPQTNRERIVHRNAQCVVIMTNGRLYAVKETCEQIEKMLNDRLVD